MGRDKLFSNYFILPLKYFMIDPCFHALRRVYMREGVCMTKPKPVYSIDWMPPHAFIDYIKTLEKASCVKRGLTAFDREQKRHHEGMRRRYMLREQYR